MCFFHEKIKNMACKQTESKRCNKAGYVFTLYLCYFEAFDIHREPFSCSLQWSQSNFNCITPTDGMKVK